MSTRDITLIAKKVSVGIIVTLIPMIILLTGIWLTQSILGSH